MAEIDQEEIYNRMQKYWEEADDFHKTASIAHLALPEANAIVNHAIFMMDNMIMESMQSVQWRDVASAMEQFERQKFSLLTHVFLAAYNMGKAGDPLIKVPAGCAHNHGIEN